MAGELHLSTPAINAGVRHLGENKKLAKWVERYPKPTSSTSRPQPFRQMVRAICNQQISRAAGKAVENRLGTLFGGKFTPAAVNSCSIPQLQSAGLSLAKAKSLHNLSEVGLKGKFSTPRLNKLTNEQIVSEITSLPGCGLWTAHMLLIFGLGRADILPVGDGAIVRAGANLLGLANHKSKQSVAALESYGAKHWAPHRSLAAYYLWCSLD